MYVSLAWEWVKMRGFSLPDERALRARKITDIPDGGCGKLCAVAWIRLIYTRPRPYKFGGRPVVFRNMVENDDGLS